MAKPSGERRTLQHLVPPGYLPCMATVISSLNEAQRESENPDGTSPSQKDIAALAYEFWEIDGRPDGKDVQHWLLAEENLKLARKFEMRS